LIRPPIYEEDWFRDIITCIIAGMVSGIILVPTMELIEFIIKKNIMEYVACSIIVVASVITILGLIDIEKQIRKLK
jgi:hypothetical protein